VPPPSPRAPGAAVDQTEGYAARVTGSTIYNFWSYLVSILEEGNRLLLFEIRHTLIATDYHKTKPSAPSAIASGPPGEAEAPAGGRHQEHFERYLTRNELVIRKFFLTSRRKNRNGGSLNGSRSHRRTGSSRRGAARARAAKQGLLRANSGSGRVEYHRRWRVTPAVGSAGNAPRAYRGLGVWTASSTGSWRHAPCGRSMGCNAWLNGRPRLRSVRSFRPRSNASRPWRQRSTAAASSRTRSPVRCGVRSGRASLGGFAVLTECPEREGRLGAVMPGDATVSRARHVESDAVEW